MKTPSLLFFRNKGREGFTLMEMMITMAIFILLAGAVFGIILGVLRSTSTLQDNQNRRDQIVALKAYLQKRFRELPAQSALLSYQRNGEGLVQNGVALVRLGNRAGEAPVPIANAIEIDARIQPNGLYTLRQVTLTEADTTSLRLGNDGSSVPLLRDVKTIQWKFLAANTSQWTDRWNNNSSKPNLVELIIQLAGDQQPVTLDFWLPALEPVPLVQLVPVTPHAP